MSFSNPDTITFTLDMFLPIFNAITQICKFATLQKLPPAGGFACKETSPSLARTVHDNACVHYPIIIFALECMIYDQQLPGGSLVFLLRLRGCPPRARKTPEGSTQAIVKTHVLKRYVTRTLPMISYNYCISLFAYMFERDDCKL